LRGRHRCRAKSGTRCDSLLHRRARIAQAVFHAPRRGSDRGRQRLYLQGYEDGSEGQAYGEATPCRQVVQTAL
ncbi:hypothetical protein LTR16_011263, partial [Cryomyces antarcticus]